MEMKDEEESEIPPPKLNDQGEILTTQSQYFFWKLLINTKYTFVYIIHFYRSVYCEILENRGIQALHKNCTLI